MKLESQKLSVYLGDLKPLVEQVAADEHRPQAEYVRLLIIRDLIKRGLLDADEVYAPHERRTK